MFGINVTRNFQIVGEGARMLNIMPKSIQEPYDALSELISTASDDDVRLNAKMPMTYAQVGTRVFLRRTHGFAPTVPADSAGGRCVRRSLRGRRRGCHECSRRRRFPRTIRSAIGSHQQGALECGRRYQCVVPGPAGSFYRSRSHRRRARFGVPLHGLAKHGGAHSGAPRVCGDRTGVSRILHSQGWPFCVLPMSSLQQENIPCIHGIVVASLLRLVSCRCLCWRSPRARGNPDLGQPLPSLPVRIYPISTGRP